jgi:hypothetical protein
MGLIFLSFPGTGFEKLTLNDFVDLVHQLGETKEARFGSRYMLVDGQACERRSQTSTNINRELIKGIP